MVLDFLNFYKNSTTLAVCVLADFFLFVTNKKRVVRFSVNSTDFKNLQEICIKHGVPYNYLVFYTQDFGNGWTSIASQKIKMNEYDEETIVFVIGKAKRDVDDCIKAESENDFTKAGILLNYPQCCIKSYLEIEPLKQNWYKYYLDINECRFPLWANRLNTIFGGGSFIGELFPCSLNCKNAIEIGKEANRSMISIGFNSLSKLFIEHCSAPIYIDNKRNISKHKTEFKIEFY